MRKKKVWKWNIVNVKNNIMKWNELKEYANSLNEDQLEKNVQMCL